MDIQSLSNRLISGERRALAQAITLVESSRTDHREQAIQLLDLCRAAGREALRIGLSGTPGVGKSSFIESFGQLLTAKGLRIAVLAVDPSSARSGGSILGDKTRMELLSRDPNAFIRPSPSQTQLGGVARATREAVLLCEAAGYDIVLIETVGVGQSETMVAEMSDLFALLLAPAGGDELQGVKRGIMEMADIILVNKSDGDLRPAATRTCADYAGALRLLRARPQDAPGFPMAMMASAIEGTGLDEAWLQMCTLADWRKKEGVWDARRAAQSRHWFDQEVRLALLDRLRRGPGRAAMDKFGALVEAGEMTAADAAARVVETLGGNQTE